MAAEQHCSAYRDGQFTCANGFMQNIGCRGATCWSCGRPSKTVPWCLCEDIPARWLTDDGKPVFYRPARSEGGNKP